MKRSVKAALIIVVLLLACVALLVWPGSRPDELDQLDDPVAASASDNSRSPSFAVRVIMPRLGLPLGGILPDFLVRKLGGTPSELRFDQAIPPTALGSGRRVAGISSLRSTATDRSLPGHASCFRSGSAAGR